MTKKELQAMMAEIKAEQDAARETAITKDDIKAIMLELMNGKKPENRIEKKTDEKPENKVEDKPEVKTITKENEVQLTQDEMKEFMKDFVKGDTKDKVKQQNVKAQGGGNISLFKESKSSKGFGF